MNRILTTTLVFLPYMAMAANGADGGDGQQNLNTFQDVLAAGGWPMDVLLFLSILATFLILFFLFTLRAGMLYPRQFMREAENAAADGDIEAFQNLCADHRCPAARILRAAAENIGPDMEQEYAIVRDAIEDEGARQAGFLWQRIQYLMDIAVIAPMVGLLGTVLGMLESFAGMRLEVGGVNPISLSQGISKALVTTAGGLIVGIAAMVLYAVFRGRVNHLISDMESACNEVLRLFISTRLKTAREGRS